MTSQSPICAGPDSPSVACRGCPLTSQDSNELHSSASSRRWKKSTHLNRLLQLSIRERYQWYFVVVLGQVPQLATDQLLRARTVAINHDLKDTGPSLSRRLEDCRQSALGRALACTALLDGSIVGLLVSSAESIHHLPLGVSQDTRKDLPLRYAVMPGKALELSLGLDGDDHVYALA